MKKSVFATVLALMALLLTGCQKDQGADRIAEMVLGRWIVDDINGHPALTNEKAVITFRSAQEAFMSASFNADPGVSTVWKNQIAMDVTITGNLVTLTGSLDEHTTIVQELTVDDITYSQTRGTLKVTLRENGSPVKTVEETI